MRLLTQFNTWWANRKRFEKPSLEDVELFNEAVTEDDADAVTEALKKFGALILEPSDRDGRDPLMYAAFFGSLRSLKILLDAGADKNWQDDEGDTALHHALRDGEHACAETLVQAGARVDIRNDMGDYALDLAAAKMNYNFVDRLLQAGAKKELNPDDTYQDAITAYIADWPQSAEQRKIEQAWDAAETITTGIPVTLTTSGQRLALRPRGEAKAAP